MEYEFTGNRLTGKDRALQRFFEIMPGATSWGIIIGMSFMAFFFPLVSAVLIIAFYLYWLLRLLYLTFFLVLSYVRLSSEKRTDWMSRIRGIDELPEYWEQLQSAPKGKVFEEEMSLFFHKKEVENLKASNKSTIRSENIYHLVIIPVVKEDRSIVEPGIRGIAKGVFPPEKIIIVFALEERASIEIKKDCYSIQEEYRNSFYDFLVVVHPDGIGGEAKAKGANTTFAAKEAAKYLKEKQIPFDNVISSCFDSDTVIAPEYFAALTYYFLVFPEREKASFQPVPVYNNNIWDAPGITRVLDVGSSFFQLVEATNPEKLVTFSSHSMSFKALDEVGYWPVDMISDDSAIYWKAFIHYDGNYHVVPMYTTLSMDANVADTTWKTIVNVYKQKRRWAWGVENFPIVMRAFIKDKKIRVLTKLKTGFKLFEGHISWTTWAFLLTIIGWLPAIFAGKEFTHSVFYYSIPRITGTIFHLATISLVTSIILSLLLLPKKKETKNPIGRRIIFAFQWLLVPLTMIFLSALPALDAQTRLLLGKYMTFWVTEKGRKEK